MAAALTRWVVSKRYTGLGDCILSLLAAWEFARRTRRTLVIDWRCSCYLRRSHRNLYDALFEPTPHIAGVPVVSGDEIDRLPLGNDFYPTHWTAAKVADHMSLRELAERATAETVALLHSRKDVSARTVVFDSCLSDALPGLFWQHVFLAGLKPREELVGRLDAFWSDRFGERSVIGIHVRHGNGGNIMGHARHWRDETVALETIARKIENARNGSCEAWPLFLCTDSFFVESWLLERFPDLITRPKEFRPVGKGELHLGGMGLDDAENALIEMLALSRCRCLVAFPPESFFSYLARMRGPTSFLNQSLRRVAERYNGSLALRL